jgi:hypothetical protein
MLQETRDRGRNAVSRPQIEEDHTKDASKMTPAALDRLTSRKSATVPKMAVKSAVAF